MSEADPYEPFRAKMHERHGYCGPHRLGIAIGEERAQLPCPYARPATRDLFWRGVLVGLGRGGNDAMIPTGQVAVICGVKPRDVRRWVSRGDIPDGPRGSFGQGRGCELLWTPRAVEQALARSKEVRGHDYNRPGMKRGRGQKRNVLLSSLKGEG